MMAAIEMSLQPYDDGSGHRFEITCTNDSGCALVMVRQGSDMLAIPTLQDWETLREGINSCLDAMSKLSENNK